METLKIKLGTRTIEIDLYEAGERVTNPFTGKSAYLKPLALSLYDWIMGVQMLVTHPLASTQRSLIIASFEPENLTCSHFSMLKKRHDFLMRQEIILGVNGQRNTWCCLIKE
ncbi:MAG: hypothetical protein IPP51_07480 [Bacteroidetes bacterium]|nr:hypothetical protein [Bacteroidota bacterium]